MDVTAGPAKAHTAPPGRLSTGSIPGIDPTLEN